MDIHHFLLRVFCLELAQLLSYGATANRQVYKCFRVGVASFVPVMSLSSNLLTRGYAQLWVGEAVIAPGFSLIVGMFYKREEQPARYGIASSFVSLFSLGSNSWLDRSRQAAWFLGNCIASLLGRLIAYGIGNIEIYTVTNWQLLFLIFWGSHHQPFPSFWWFYCQIRPTSFSSWQKQRELSLCSEPSLIRQELWIQAYSNQFTAWRQSKIHRHTSSSFIPLPKTFPTGVSPQCEVWEKEVA